MKLVGLEGLEPSTKGFTHPRHFCREWTISSPSSGECQGAGSSCLLLRTLESSGSLCTFRECTPGLAQGCHQPCC